MLVLSSSSSVPCFLSLSMVWIAPLLPLATSLSPSLSSLLLLLLLSSSSLSPLPLTLHAVLRCAALRCHHHRHRLCHSCCHDRSHCCHCHHHQYYLPCIIRVTQSRQKNNYETTKRCSEDSRERMPFVMEETREDGKSRRCDDKRRARQQASSDERDLTNQRCFPHKIHRTKILFTLFISIDFQ